jgi:hypothetical protein
MKGVAMVTAIFKGILEIDSPINCPSRTIKPEVMPIKMLK